MAAEPEILWVSPHLLTPNPWNPNKMDAFMYAKAIGSIKEFGFLDPITTRPKGKGFEIIDGEHRWKVAIDVGLDRVPIIAVSLTDAQAKKLTILLNELRGTADPADLGALLKELLETESAEDLAGSLPFTADFIGSIVDLPEIDWDAVSAKTEAPAKDPDKERWVERTYRMPASVASMLDEAIEHAKDGEMLEDWQAIERIFADYLAS